MSFTSAAHAKAVELGKLSIEITTAAGSGHPSTALSLAHLVTVLMYHAMKWDPKDPWNPHADRLVLSEGHAVPIIYAALADLGATIGKTAVEGHAMTRDHAMTLREISSPIDGHPNPALGVPFFDAATGSLGQGLSVAAGLAMAARMDANPRTIYCLIGDGESREGQICEAMDFIVDHTLTACVPIFNCNELAQSDWVSPQQSADVLARKCEAFGFITRTIDGHDPESIRRAIAELPVIRNGHRPLAIVARTIKGWGAQSEQGMGHHGTAVKKEKLAEVLQALDQTANDIGAKPADLKITPPPTSLNPEPRTLNPSHIDFEHALESNNLLDHYKSNKPLAPRKAYGLALLALAENDPRIVGLDADVKNSTYAEYLAKHRAAQFVECRIAEQNMISVAAGLAAAGKIPFCSTFAKFVERAYDQVEMAIISGANFKITGSHAGVTLAADGPSQMSLPDVAFFRSFCHVNNYAGQPACRYFFPADALSCFKLTEMMANLDGFCYQRTLRADVPRLYDPSETFEERGFKVLREGRDVTLVAAGYMVHECLKAADELRKSSRSATVIDAYTLPLDAEKILQIAARSGARIITVEDNYPGGLDAELATAIAHNGDEITLTPLRVGRIPKSGREPAHVLEYLGLDHQAILKAI